VHIFRNHQNSARFAGRGYHGIGIAEVRGDWFLDEHMLPQPLPPSQLPRDGCREEARVLTPELLCLLQHS